MSVQQGNLLAVGTSKGLVQIWDVAASKKISVYEGHTARVGKAFVYELG
jgi:cell division cycle 20-like protein 1 (cofactor of APC complex)